MSLEADPLSSGLSPISSLSRRDAVTREVRRAIVQGTLKPGERLTETTAATSLQVSRPTMREALTRLAQEGLLVQEPYRGLRVAVLDADEIMDFSRTRLSLDLLAAEGILADQTGSRTTAVEEAWLDYDRIPVDADVFVAHEAHVAFHRRLWEASENTFLIRLWPVTEAHLTIALAQDQLVHNDQRRIRLTHRRIVEAIVGGDLTVIRRALIAHTIESAQELIAAEAELR